MSVAENVVLMRRWFKEVWNEGRVQTIHELMAKNAIGIGQDQSGVVIHGPLSSKGSGIGSPLAIFLPSANFFSRRRSCLK